MVQKINCISRRRKIKATVLTQYTLRYKQIEHLNMRNSIYNIEPHPFESLIRNETKYLIVGTFPTHKDNFTFNYFYSGKENNFWIVMEEVCGRKFLHFEGANAIAERQNLLLEFRIGITDMHELCYRRNNSSSDDNLFSIKLKDIFLLLNKYPSIDRLILTSRGEVFGAWGLLKTYFFQKDYPVPIMTRRPDKILEGTMIHNSKEIKIFIPYSPSPRLINEKRTTLKELISMYSYCLS
jgi:G:T/U-mismatch repair DNA glycosylase